MTSEWARKLVAQTKGQQEQRRIATLKTLSDREIVESNGESKWRNVCSILTHRTDELNEASGDYILRVGTGADLAAIFIKDSPNSLASITFDATNYTLKVPFHGCELRLEVTSKDELVWKSTCTTDVWSDEGVAQKTAEYAWEQYSRS